MKKVTLNYWLDLATGIAFLACAITGIVFLFPSLVHTSGGAPTIAWIPATWWHTVHDWSGVAMAVGVGVHVAMHAKWIKNMTRKTFGAWGDHSPQRPAARVAAGTAQRAAGAAPRTAGAAPHAAATPDVATYAAASLRRLGDLRAERQHEREQRISRRRFLAGAGAVGGLALLAGVGLIGRDAITAAATTSEASTSSSGSSGGTSAATTGGGTGGESSGSSTGQSSGSGSTQSSSSGQSSSATSSARVVVDENACVACGRCLQTCPQSVFDWSSSGRATAQSPDACIRCGRCLQVCPAGAITINT